MPLKQYQWATEKDCSALKKFFEIQHLIYTVNESRKTEGIDLEEYRSIDKLLVGVDNETLEPVELLEGESWGFFLEISARFSKEVQDKLADLPPMPENVALTAEDLSQKSYDQLKKNFKTPESYKSTKLISHFEDRKKYVVHSATAVQYSQMGVEIYDVTRAVKCIHKRFLKDWIELCTEQRIRCASAGDEGGKNFWKLMINSTFGMQYITRLANILVLCLNMITGKFCEDLRRRRRCVFTRCPARIRKELSSPYFESCRLVNDTMLQINSYQPHITLDRPIAIG